MHLIELKGYERKKLKDQEEADELYFWEEEADPEGMPEDVYGDTDADEKFLIFWCRNAPKCAVLHLFSGCKI